MPVPPFIARPTSEATEVTRARLVVLLATIGIAAALLAYAISPAVRHAVGHAAHSVSHSVSNVIDKDKKREDVKRTPAKKATHPKPARSSHTATTRAGGS